ncbi:MAG: galactosyldiacylglycerol synthase [Blastochloris sp.]|nr:galactosyldiacylglycerol synthase [Blastochloris sp.]
MPSTPKKILILTAGFGEGHNTAARNLREGLLHVGGESVQAEVLDCFADSYGAYNEFTRKAYIGAINETPKLWQLFYRMLDQTRIFELTLPTMAKLQKDLGKLITSQQPDLVCTTYPIYAFLFNRLYPDPAQRPFRLINVVTDSISVNSLWYRTPSDQWLVPNTQTAEVMQAAGTPSDRLHVFGFPVQLAFHLPDQRRTPPDPSTQTARILYIINSGKLKAPATVRAILESSSAHLTVSVGRDQRLRRQIEHVALTFPGRVELLGWTDQMPQMMMSHNLVITKAGGATVQEALAACCPLIINQVVPGQEEGNWELVRRIQGGALAQNPQEVAHWVKKALDQNAALAKTWHHNLQAVCRADSSIQIARHLLAL